MADRNRTPMPSVRGATVLELLGASALVIAFFGIALPRFDRVAYTLDREAASLSLVLESARNIALNREYPVAVSFEIVPQRLRLHYDLDADGRVDANEETLHVPLRPDVAFGTGAAAPLRPRSDPTDFDLLREGRPTVVFSPAGTASESGVVHLTTRLAAGDESRPSDARAITIEAHDGSVECLSYRTRFWEATC